ncbi:unnamed protein product [Macrosiphum euphorbiae]|uniref:Transposase n=1 Tax=Macrosiphum euphorbiae TaxID=13131 RepID=A0AAV0WVD1_9HEMI|nr:unnamed protein product [Macrosiphum euphorbiae]
MSRRRLNTILKLAANTSEENVNAMPTLVTSPQNKDVPVDLPILTYEDIMNSEIIFQYTENNIKDFPDFETVSTSQVTNIASTSQQSCYEHSIVVSADSSVNNVEENDINLFTDCFINDTLVTMDDNIENEILVNSNGESNLVNCDKKTKTRSVRSEKIKWKRETTKNNRMNGEIYTGYKRNGKVVEHNSIKAARSMKKSCTSKRCEKLPNRHCQEFEESRRLEIFKKFWSATWEEKKMFVIGMVSKMLTKANTTGLGSLSRRANTYKYFLEHDHFEEPLQVCKLMFLNTLGLNEWMLHNWVRNATHGLPGKLLSPKSLKLKENVGDSNLIKSSPKRVGLSKRIDHLQLWFSSLPKMPSHYCRQKTNRLYLEGPFYNKQQVFEAYKQKCIDGNLVPLSICYVYNFMREKKLSIFVPRKDKCDTCSSYEMGNIDENVMAEHVAFKNRAREEMNLDKQLAINENKFYMFTMDCQAVKLCPTLTASALYYSTKLKVHNMTFYNMVTGHCKNYWWHEGDGDLEASIFVSILLCHLENYCMSDKKPIIIYSDG